VIIKNALIATLNSLKTRALPGSLAIVTLGLEKKDWIFLYIKK
jgi:hypothetical protein